MNAKYCIKRKIKRRKEHTWPKSLQAKFRGQMWEKSETFRTVEYLDTPLQKKFADYWIKPSEISSNSDSLCNYEINLLIKLFTYNCILHVNLQLLIYAVAFLYRQTGI